MTDAGVWRRFGTWESSADGAARGGWVFYGTGTFGNYAYVVMTRSLLARLIVFDY